MNRWLNAIQYVGLIVSVVALGAGAAWFPGTRLLMLRLGILSPALRAQPLVASMANGGPVSASMAASLVAQTPSQPIPALSSAPDQGYSAATPAAKIRISIPPRDKTQWPNTVKGSVRCEPPGSLRMKDLGVAVDGKRAQTTCGIDDQGRFQVSGLPWGTYSVSVRRGTVVDEILGPDDQVRFDANCAERDVVLKIAAPIQVTLVAQEQGTGQPVDGLLMRVQAGAGPSQTSSITDSDGQCVFWLAPGNYRPEARLAPGSAPVQVAPSQIMVVGNQGAMRLVLSVPARASESVEGPGRARLDPNDALECLLVDSTGSPAPGFVKIRGMYQADDTEPNTHLVIPIQPDAFPSEWSIGRACDASGGRARRFAYKQKGRSRMEVVLEPTAVITGRVKDPNGLPIRDALMDLETSLPDGSVRSGDRSFYSVSVADDGRFVFTGVPVGLPVKVLADAQGRLTARSRALELKPAQRMDVGDMILTTQRPEDGVIAGRVTDENGSPVTGYVTNENGSRMPRCTVRVASDWMCPLTGPRGDGRFTLGHLPKDRDLTVSIDVVGYGHWSKITRADDNSCDFQVFPEGWRIIGGQAPALVAAQWWNSQPVSIGQARGKVVVLALGVDPFWESPAQSPGVSYARPLMDVHRRFGGGGVQVIIVWTSLHTYPRSLIDRVRQDLVDAYLEPDDLSFAVCVDAEPSQVEQVGVQRCESRGATYTLYQARRPNSLVVIDKQGIVRAYVSPKELEGWVERLVGEIDH